MEIHFLESKIPQTHSLMNISSIQNMDGSTL